MAGTLGGTEITINILETHSNNVDVCKSGCDALWSLISNNG